MPQDDLSWAVETFRDQRRYGITGGYALAVDYYEGRHRLQFATEKYRQTFGTLFRTFCSNLTPAVIDSLVDRLEVTGFVSPDPAGADTRRDEEEPPGDPAAEHAWAIWRRNRMDSRSNEVHRESFLSGDGYVIVEPGPEGAVIWPQPARQMAVEYDEATPGAVTRAAKLWRAEDGRLRLTVYLADRTERYVGRRPTRTQGLGSARPRDFVPYLPPGADDLAGDGVAPNPYGRVPVFHFPNKRVHAPGISELADVIPIQDALNKALMDMLVAMEFGAFRQRWVTGIEVEVDEVTGQPKPPPWRLGEDRFVTATNPEARFGDFNQTDLTHFLAVQESLRSEIARISGTPLHYLFITRGDFPSGEAMKSAEARFTKKIRDRQVTLGAAWEDVMAFALVVEGEGARARPEVLWETASPRSELENVQVMLMKQKLGVSRRQLLRELGYDEALVEQMLEEGQQAAADSATTHVVLNGGGAPLSLPVGDGRVGVP